MSTSADPASAETTTRRAGIPIYKRRRRRIYGIAGVVVVLVIALIVWAVTHPHSPIGPHGLVDWIPLGMLNAATGLWLLAVIRHRAR